MTTKTLKTETGLSAADYMRKATLETSLEKFHPDLHDAVRQRHESVQIDESRGSMTTSWTLGQLYTPEASKKFAREIEKFVTKNKSRIKKLGERYRHLQAEMSKADKARDQLRSNNYDNYHNTRDAWKNIAKPLGIHPILTDKGQISRSKMQKVVQKKGEKEAKRLLDIYNEQYIPQVNKALKKAQANTKTLSQADSNKIESRNRLVPECNEVLKQLALLSANTYDARKDEFKKIEGYWGSDYF